MQLKYEYEYKQLFSFFLYIYSSSVLVVSSTRSGMGKSLYITRRADKLNQATTNQYMHVIIPIHGPTVTNDILMDFFNQHRIRSAYKVYHLDIAPQVCYYKLNLYSYFSVAYCNAHQHTVTGSERGRLSSFLIAHLERTE